MRDSHTAIELPLTGSGRKPVAAVLLTLCVLLLALVGLVIGMRLNPPHDASVVPASILAAVVFSFTPFVLLRIVSRARATVEGGDLVMQTGVGQKRVPLSHLRRHGVEIVDLTLHPELRPRLRFWGVSMPGLSSGWFRLRNGEKAVCLLTDRRRVSYLRSDAETLTLLLSLKSPEVLRQMLEG